MRRTRNARSQDLARLLRNTSKRSSTDRPAHDIINGNHRIAITAGRRAPAPDQCKGCPNHLACFAGRQDEALRRDGEWMLRPCHNERRFVEFYYHGSCCLVYDIQTGAVSDLGMYGYSVTTTRSIRWYLEAVADNFANGLTGDRIGEIMTFFKKRTLPKDMTLNHRQLLDNNEDIGWVTP